jgi:hypothetical protein
MTKISTFNFEASGIKFTEQEIERGASSFSQRGLGGALGLEMGQGNFNPEGNLVVSDSFPIFSANSGELSATPNIETSAKSASPPPTPTTGPYIWSYKNKS